MASKLFFILFLAISSLAFLGSAQQTGGADNGGAGSTLPCVPKLLPCQATLVSHSTAPPPDTCCIPLKQIAQDDPKCLCDVFSNPALLQSLNITQEDGLTLAKNCHVNADTSICKTAAGKRPVSSPVTPSHPATSNGSSSIPTPSKSAAIVLEARFGKPAAISSALFLLHSTVGLI